MAERYEDNFSFYSTVVRESKVFERWFRIASGNVDYFDVWEDSLRDGTHEADQYFALYWQQFESTVLSEEPGNDLFRASLLQSDDLVRSLFQCDAMPTELLED